MARGKDRNEHGGGFNSWFAAAHRRLWPKAVNVALASLGQAAPRDEGEDVAEQAFVELWSAGAKRNDSYILNRVKRRAIDANRNRQKRRAGRNRWALDREVFGASSRNPERELRARRACDLLAAALATLPQREREAFEFVRMKGMSYKEAAAALDLAHNTVKEYLRRAANHLTEYLSGHGMDSLDDVWAIVQNGRPAVAAGRQAQTTGSTFPRPGSL